MLQRVNKRQQLYLHILSNSGKGLVMNATGEFHQEEVHSSLQQTGISMCIMITKPTHMYMYNYWVSLSEPHIVHGNGPPM